MNKIFTIKKRNPKMLWGLGVPTVLKYQLPLEFIENDWKPWKWSPGCWQHTVESESHFCCDLKVGTGSFINVSLCNTICISIYFSAEWLLVGGLSPKWLQSDIWLWLAICCRYFQELGRVSPCVFPCIYLRLMNYGLVHPFRLSHIRGLSYQPICSCWLHQRIINIFFN